MSGTSSRKNAPAPKPDSTEMNDAAVSIMGKIISIHDTVECDNSINKIAF
jgi:hypothetical protein